jgi:predicted metal-dependent hydrolase
MRAAPRELHLNRQVSLYSDKNKPNCKGELPSTAVRGLELFNAGEYWHAHEALEEAWLAESDPVRNLYKGILQAGVTYLHIRRGNYRGALKVYRRAIRWLEQYPANCKGIDVAKLRADLRAAIVELERLGPNQIDMFQKEYFKPLVWL